jgi:hypothetical protein
MKIADRCSIPEGEALVRILRYQAQNERGLNRALTQLERLQRHRKGENVPAPVKVSCRSKECSERELSQPQDRGGIGD